jgi:beta-ureidopropionase / N-carbamoyl-L-amino-acid hydrolase
MAAALRINPERLTEDLAGLSRIGLHEDGSVTRLAFSPAELRARQYVMHLCQRAGISVRLDGIGNLIARVEGEVTGEAAVAMGSHIDSVPRGGRFDGAMGVIAALEVVRTIKEAGTPLAHPLEVLVFVAEESSRFGVSTIGSSAMAGTVEPDRLLGLTDRMGHRLSEILARSGLTGADVAAARRLPGEVGHYLELHIEQGRVLKEAGEQVGVVRAIAAPCRLKVRYEGRADHSGATPMDLRKDALAAAAHLVTYVEEVCRAPGPVPVVGTVGMLDVRPGSINVIPGEATLWIDLRSIGLEARTTRRDAVVARARALAAERGLTCSIDTLMDDPPVVLDSGTTEVLADVCAAQRLAWRLMDSGAGHDAMQMAAITRAGMLFVPSDEGISHNPREWTSLPDIVAGAQVLLEATVRLATRAGKAGAVTQ